MRISNLNAFLFPYRTHLEQEIEYLKDQIASMRRANDTLNDAFIEALNPKPKSARSPAKLIPVKPVGWDAYRAARKNEPETEPEPGSKDQADGFGA